MKAEREQRPAKRRLGRRPLSEGDAAATRRLILEHAWRLFNTSSYASLSMESIAAAAGLTKATLYYHFASKGELLFQCVVTFTHEMGQSIRASVDDRSYSVKERLAAVLEEAYRPGYDEALLHEAMLHLPLEQQKELETLFYLWLDPLIALMAEGIGCGELRPADPRVLALAFTQIIGAVDNGYIKTTTWQEKEQLLHTLLELFLHGAAIQ